jgi:hypothetical protein
MTGGPDRKALREAFQHDVENVTGFLAAIMRGVLL